MLPKLPIMELIIYWKTVTSWEERMREPLTAKTVRDCVCQVCSGTVTDPFSSKAIFLRFNLSSCFLERPRILKAVCKRRAIYSKYGSTKCKKSDGYI